MPNCNVEFIAMYRDESLDIFIAGIKLNGKKLNI